MKQADFLIIEKHENGVASVWLDLKDQKQNVVSPAVIDILTSTFDTIQQDNDIKAVVIISKKKDFIAGADIKSFEGIQAGEFIPFIKKGHKGLNSLADGKKPIVAAIHGTCFGLGTEIALACTARIASDSPTTKFALPEVKLGLLPGGGGTQRLPRLIGLSKSLDMMLTGKNIFPIPAKKMGLIDELTDHHKLHTAALQMAEWLIKKPIQRKRKKKAIDVFLDDTSIGRALVFDQARKKSYKQTHGNYPAVEEIINCVEIGLKKGIKAGLQAEAEKFEALMIGDVSKQLRGIFFNMTDKKKNPWEGKIDYPKIKTLGVLGAGFMGAGITEISAVNGINVLLKDIYSASIAKAKAGIWKGLNKKIKRKALSKTDAEEIIGKVQGRLDYAGFEKADVVLEAVLEVMSLKKKIIKEIEENCDENVIIASNTSSLSLSEMAQAAKKPENVIGLHYFSPVPKMPLLEIVVHDKTADWVIAACYDLGVKQGKTPIIVKDGIGFYVNRILAPYLNECLLMLDEGTAIDAVDKAMVSKGMPVGPIALLDEVGLDICAHVAEQGNKLIENRPGFEANESISRMVADKRLGKKNKKGFYIYKSTFKSKSKKVDRSAYLYFKGNGSNSIHASEIQDRALSMLFNEATMCLEEGIIASPKDGDIGAIFGMGFLPYTGGPFRYMDAIGLTLVVNKMQSLASKYGPKFNPRPLLIKMAKEKSTFYEK